MILFKTIISFLKDEEYRSLLVTTFSTIAVGSVVYHNLEGWSWVDSIYFSVITLSTIGYGDLSPNTDMGKLFTIFYVIVGIGIILTFINTLYNHYRDVRQETKGKRN